MRIIGNVEAWGTGGRDYFSPPDYLTGTPYIKEGMIETAGIPEELNVREYLGYNAHTGTIVNKGPGILYVQLSSDGKTFSEAAPLEENRAISLAKEDVNKIRLNSDTDGCKYLVVAH